MFLDLTKSKGGVDAVIENVMSAKFYLEKTKMDVKPVGDVLNAKDWAFAFRKKGQETLIKQVNETLAQMKKSGELKKVYDVCFE
jgi:ABC-type amino acid transport substrate-binding protein